MFPHPHPHRPSTSTCPRTRSRLQTSPNWGQQGRNSVACIINISLVEVGSELTCRARLWVRAASSFRWNNIVMVVLSGDGWLAAHFNHIKKLWFLLGKAFIIDSEHRTLTVGWCRTKKMIYWISFFSLLENIKTFLRPELQAEKLCYWEKLVKVLMGNCW